MSVPGRTGNSRGVTVLHCVNVAGKKMTSLLIVKWKTGEQLQSMLVLLKSYIYIYIHESTLFSSMYTRARVAQ